MKIKIYDNPHKTEILDEEGKNIISALRVKDITINVKTNEFPTATLVCYITEAEIGLLPKGVNVEKVV